MRKYKNLQANQWSRFKSNMPSMSSEKKKSVFTYPLSPFLTWGNLFLSCVCPFAGFFQHSISHIFLVKCQTNEAMQNSWMAKMKTGNKTYQRYNIFGIYWSKGPCASWTHQIRWSLVEELVKVKKSIYRNGVILSSLLLNNERCCRSTKRCQIHATAIKSSFAQNGNILLGLWSFVVVAAVDWH